MAAYALGALDAARALDRGELSAEDLTRACLERAADRDDAIGAWEHLDPARTIADARELDRSPRRGPLHGLPVGIKDIIDVAGMPTRMGSPIHADARPARSDAACVALMRARGAVVLGKTVTTEFANFTPGKTRNPLAPDHTPGGSSSGSAAAVADRMVPLAVGTQTAGSVIRPAAFCGIVGYKPSFGLIPRAGIKPLADSLDTVGTFARSVPDAALLAAGLSGFDALVMTEPSAASPRLGLCRTPQWHHARPETELAIETARRSAERAGATVVEIVLDGDFLALADAQALIQAVETSRALAWERTMRGNLLSERLREQIDAGAAETLDRYAEAVALAGRCRARLGEILSGVDAVIAPSAPGIAPAGLSATGDPLFNRIWTVLHGPAVHIPVAVAADGLSVGITIAGLHGQDQRVLAAAHWVFGTLAS